MSCCKSDLEEVKRYKYFCKRCSVGKLHDSRSRHKISKKKSLTPPEPIMQKDSSEIVRFKIEQRLNFSFTMRYYARRVISIDPFDAPPGLGGFSKKVMIKLLIRFLRR